MTTLVTKTTLTELDRLVKCQDKLAELQEMQALVNPATTQFWGLSMEYNNDTLLLNLLPAAGTRLCSVRAKALGDALVEMAPALLARAITLQQQELDDRKQKLSDPLLTLAVEYRK